MIYRVIFFMPLRLIYGFNLLGALIGLASIATGIWSAKKASDSAEATNQMRVQEAEKARTWQERLNATKHQVEVEDLKKAGLNPILSAHSGASVPSGAQATGLENPVSSKIQMMNTLAQIGMNVATARNIDTQTKLAEARVPQANFFADLWKDLGSSAKQVRNFVNTGGFKDLPTIYAHSFGISKQYKKGSRLAKIQEEAVKAYKERR